MTPAKEGLGPLLEAFLNQVSRSRARITGQGSRPSIRQLQTTDLGCEHVTGIVQATRYTISR
jgi:hypothetical protein